MMNDGLKEGSSICFMTILRDISYMRRYIYILEVILSHYRIQICQVKCNISTPDYLINKLKIKKIHTTLNSKLNDYVIVQRQYQYFGGLMYRKWVTKVTNDHLSPPVYHKQIRQTKLKTLLDAYYVLCICYMSKCKHCQLYKATLCQCCVYSLFLRPPA